MRAAQKGLQLSYHFDADVPAAVVGDAAHLRQILLNLLSNAVKFTERGEVALKVTHACMEGRLTFEVRDTGIGLTEDGKCPPVPALQPGRQQHRQPIRRHGAGPGDQPAAGRADWAAG